MKGRIQLLDLYRTKGNLSQASSFVFLLCLARNPYPGRKKINVYKSETHFVREKLRFSNRISRSEILMLVDHIITHSKKHLLSILCSRHFISSQK